MGLKLWMQYANPKQNFIFTLSTHLVQEMLPLMKGEEMYKQVNRPFGG